MATVDRSLIVHLPPFAGASLEQLDAVLDEARSVYRTKGSCLFEQDKVASYETPTDGYDMLNATIAYRIPIEGGSEVELYARATNLTDELAFVHTSFVKDQSPLRGRNVVFGVRHQF